MGEFRRGMQRKFTVINRQNNMHLASRKKNGKKVRNTRVIMEKETGITGGMIPLLIHGNKSVVSIFGR
ncbi:hypothetical protein FM107_12600 [Sphingobacterium sp. JB170]|nr:hypothetical protein FM107_12600 [Sphingobacterium sp. JB170]